MPILYLLAFLVWGKINSSIMSELKTVRKYIYLSILGIIYGNVYQFLFSISIKHYIGEFQYNIGVNLLDEEFSFINRAIIIITVFLLYTVLTKILLRYVVHLNEFYEESNKETSNSLKNIGKKENEVVKNKEVLENGKKTKKQEQQILSLIEELKKDITTETGKIKENKNKKLYKIIIIILIFIFSFILNRLSCYIPIKSSNNKYWIIIKGIIMIIISIRILYINIIKEPNYKWFTNFVLILSFFIVIYSYLYNGQKVEMPICNNVVDSEIRESKTNKLVDGNPKNKTKVIYTYTYSFQIEAIVFGAFILIKDLIDDKE